MCIEQYEVALQLIYTSEMTQLRIHLFRGRTFWIGRALLSLIGVYFSIVDKN